MIGTVRRLGRLCEGVYLSKNLSDHVGGVDTAMEKGFVEYYGFNPFIHRVGTEYKETTVSDVTRIAKKEKKSRIISTQKKKLQRLTLSITCLFRDLIHFSRKAKSWQSNCKILSLLSIIHTRQCLFQN